jgi:cyclopropane fatty-acyl-phospholipid synthase-like methyltransferase
MMGVTPPSIDRVRAFYDKFAQARQVIMNDNIHFGYWEESGNRTVNGTLEDAATRMTDQVIRRLHVGLGMRVLDLGCGRGGPAIRIAKNTGAEVVGITVSPEEVDRATALGATEGVGDRVSFELCNALDMPYPSASFDAVLAVESLCHMDRQEALRVVRRVLRPGGRLVLTDFLERAPIPSEKLAAVKSCFEEWMFASPVRPEDYPRWMRDSGLLFHEQLDITDQTIAQTFELVAARVAEREAGDMDEIINRRDLRDVWELGYVIAVGKRPPR